MVGFNSSANQNKLKLYTCTQVSVITRCFQTEKFDILNSKEIIPIEPDRHQVIVSSLTMLEMFTALVLITSVGAGHHPVKTKGTE